MAIENFLRIHSVKGRKRGNYECTEMEPIGNHGSQIIGLNQPLTFLYKGATVLCEVKICAW